MPIPYTWGTAPQELHRPFPCDGFVQGPHSAYYRGTTVNAPPEILFPWLCQMRVAPYSYDWIMMRRQLLNFKTLAEQHQ